MKGTGLVDSWVESGLLGPNAADNVMSGKAYKRAMRVHKLTLQALWRLLVPLLFKYCEEVNAGLALRISSLWSSAQNIDELIACLKSPEFRNVHGDFTEYKSQENVNFAFWWNYMEMVSPCLILPGRNAKPIGNCIWIASVPCFHTFLDTTTSITPGGARCSSPRWNSYHKKC